MAAVKKHAPEHDEDTEAVKAEAPEPKPVPAKATDSLSDLIGKAEANTGALSGYGLIVHKLEVAFVHALTGAKDLATKAVSDAEAEIEKYAPSFVHLESEFALLKAKVLAALGRKS